MQRFIFQLLSLLFFSSLVSQDKKFVFYFNSGKKTPANIKAFQDSLQKWQQKEYRIVSVKGYADSRGSDELNLRLSQKRSEKTDSVLSMLLPKNGKAEVKGFGEKFPVSSNKTERGRSKNRRVEVEMEIIPGLAEEKVKEIPAEIPGAEDTTFVLPDGTEITVKRCALEGIKISDLKIEAEEYFTVDKMILAGMYTRTADGRCLSTGGMIRYKITDRRGNLVKLNPNCPIQISMPLIGQDTAFELYDLKSKDKVVHGDSWNLRKEKVEYDGKKKRLKFQLSEPSNYINCDKLRGPPPFELVQRRNVVKTRRVKNADVYVNGGPSVLKLNRFKVKKHDTRICQCIPLNEQYVTAYKKVGNDYLFCHKKMSELKTRNFFGQRIIIRKRDYKKVSGESGLQSEMKDIFGKKESLS